MSGGLLRVGILLTALGVSACAGAPGTPVAAIADQGNATKQAALPGAGTNVAVIRPPAPPKKLAADDLVGLRGAELQGLFGSPVQLRREPPGEIWQFAGGRCVLLVFLYPASGNNEPRVQHAETMRRGNGGVNEPECLESLRRSTLS